MSKSPTNQTEEREHSAVEATSRSLNGEDEPMEVNHPESPFLLVFATYPVLLIAVILLALGVYWWMNWT